MSITIGLRNSKLGDVLVDEHLKPSLLTAIAFLEKNNFRYAIIGGIALSVWDVARYTHDVDLKVVVPKNDYTAARKKLRAAFPDRARKHIPENLFIVDVNINEVVVDFLLALPGYDELVVERATQHDLGDFKAWICSAEDLVVQKASAGRLKDLADIESLLRAHRGNLDEDYIENWVTQFAEALERPEILTDYHRLLAKSKSLE